MSFPAGLHGLGAGASKASKPAANPTQRADLQLREATRTAEAELGARSHVSYTQYQDSRAIFRMGIGFYTGPKRTGPTTGLCFGDAFPSALRYCCGCHRCRATTSFQIQTCPRGFVVEVRKEWLAGREGILESQHHLRSGFSSFVEVSDLSDTGMSAVVLKLDVLRLPGLSCRYFVGGISTTTSTTTGLLDDSDSPDFMKIPIENSPPHTQRKGASW